VQVKPQSTPLNGYILANTVLIITLSSTYLKYWWRVDGTIQLAWIQGRPSKRL